MLEPKEPRYAAGQELTLHPDDPVRGAELMKGQQPNRQQSRDAERDPNMANLADVAPRIYYT